MGWPTQMVHTPHSTGQYRVNAAPSTKSSHLDIITQRPMRDGSGAGSVQHGAPVEFGIDHGRRMRKRTRFVAGVVPPHFTTQNLPPPHSLDCTLRLSPVRISPAKL